jgi:hypothetical protein
MKRPIILKAGLVLCVLVVLNACQKEISTAPKQEISSARTSGAVEDDQALVDQVPVTVSSGFVNIAMQATSKGGGKGGHTGGGTTPTGDVTAPTVTITSPSNGSAVSGTVNVSVNASDNVGVTSLSLSADGSVIGTSASSSYTFTWNSSTAGSGTHTLSAKATDAAGNYNTYSISVTTNTIVLPPPPSMPSGYQLVMPPVQNQGSEFACVAFAAGYAVRSVEQFYKTGSSGYSYSTNLFSPEFLYDQTKLTDCASGTSILKALDFMKSSGICTWQSMPYSDLNGCSQMPTSSQSTEAGNFKISSYTKLNNTDVDAIKTMLLNKHPLVFMVATDQSFWNAGPGFIWSSYSGSPGVGHALAICGFDDAKHAWRVFNSWGTNWGDAGYSWIDYDFLPQASYYSYAVTL